MLNLTIAIFDKDQGYLQKLAEYFAKQNHHPIYVHPFSDETLLDQFLETHSTDILLISQTEYKKGAFPCLAIPLIEDLAENLEGLPAIRKYQRADRILSKAIEYYTQSSKKTFAYEGLEAGKIIGVYSPNGGCGKTTLALGLAKHLAEMGKKVLWLSWEETPSYQELFNGNEDSSFSNLIYYVHKRDVNLMMRLYGISRVDSETGLSYLPAPITPQDLILQDEDLAFMMKGLRGQGHYEYLVMDLESSWKEMKRILPYCHHVIKIKGKSALEKKKWAQVAPWFKELFGQIEQTDVINGVPGYDREIEGDTILQIPFIQGLYRSDGHSTRMDRDDAFKEAIRRIGEVVMNHGN